MERRRSREVKKRKMKKEGRAPRPADSSWAWSEPDLGKVQLRSIAPLVAVATHASEWLDSGLISAGCSAPAGVRLARGRRGLLSS